VPLYGVTRVTAHDGEVDFYRCTQSVLPVTIATHSLCCAMGPALGGTTIHCSCRQERGAACQCKDDVIRGVCHSARAGACFRFGKVCRYIKWSVCGMQADVAAACKERLQVSDGQSSRGRPTADPSGIWTPDTSRWRQPACPQRQIRYLAAGSSCSVSAAFESCETATNLVRLEAACGPRSLLAKSNFITLERQQHPKARQRLQARAAPITQRLCCPQNKLGSPVMDSRASKTRRISSACRANVIRRVRVSERAVE